MTSVHQQLAERERDGVGRIRILSWLEEAKDFFSRELIIEKYEG